MLDEFWKTSRQKSKPYTIVAETKFAFVRYAHDRETFLNRGGGNGHYNNFCCDFNFFFCFSDEIRNIPGRIQLISVNRRSIDNGNI